MTRFGPDEIGYKCPRLDKGVIIGLYYDMYQGEKIYTSIDCESRNECDIDEGCNWQSCPAYKEYIGDHH